MQKNRDIMEQNIMQNQPTPGNPGIILPISPLVLIVEDDEMVRSAEERILSRHYRIKSANDGTTALPLIEEGAALPSNT